MENEQKLAKELIIIILLGFLPFPNQMSSIVLQQLPTKTFFVFFWTG
jgi:hypothetical protein